jgi:hypothetical protein
MCAKLLIQQAVQDWITGRIPAPVMLRRCQCCQQQYEEYLPDTITDAQCEYVLPTGYRGDVVLLAGDSPVLDVEVRVTHTVTKQKAEQIGISLIEVKGQAICEVPATWLILPSDGCAPSVCPDCQQQQEAARLQRQQQREQMDLRQQHEQHEQEAARLLFWQELQRIAQTCDRWKKLPDVYYCAYPTHCWNCKKDMLVFTWPGARSNAEPRHTPRPSTLLQRAGTWSNVCPFCHKRQGHSFLYKDQKGAPFSSFTSVAETTPVDPHTAWQADMRKLSWLWYLRQCYSQSDQRG